MAVLQRRDPAKAATRLQHAVGKDVEVHVVNRQVCVIMTPLVADQLASRLQIPKSVARRAAADQAGADSPQVVISDDRPVVIPDPAPVVVDRLSSLGEDHWPSVKGDSPPIVIEDFWPLAAPEPAPVTMVEFPPVFVIEHTLPKLEDHQDELVEPAVSLSVLDEPVASPFDEPTLGEPDSEQPENAPALGSRTPGWVRRFETAVKDELDWYRHRL
jgi:hypothetical protein